MNSKSRMLKSWNFEEPDRGRIRRIELHLALIDA